MVLYHVFICNTCPNCAPNEGCRFIVEEDLDKHIQHDNPDVDFLPEVCPYNSPMGVSHWRYVGYWDNVPS